MAVRGQELGQRRPWFAPAHPSVVRPAEPQGRDSGRGGIAAPWPVYFTASRAAVVYRYRSVPEEGRGLEAPGEEVREGSHFLSQEVLFCPVWPGLAHSGLDLGAQAACYVVYFFLLWPHCRRKAEVQALVLR